MAEEAWDIAIGSVADEATRLLESLRRTTGADPSGAARPFTDPGPAPSPGSTPDPSAETTHDPTCTWCPVCRTVRVARSLSPETLSRLADLAGFAAGVLDDLATRRANAAADARAETPGPDADTRPDHDGRPSREH